MTRIRILGILVCVWLIAVASRFCGIALHGVATPFNAGLDWVWFVAWLVIALFVLLATALLPGRTQSLVWVIPAAAAVVVLWLSGIWLQAIAAAWLVLLCAGMGARVVRKFVGIEDSWLESAVCGIPLGVGIISSIVLLLGLLGWLTATAIWILLSA